MTPQTLGESTTQETPLLRVDQEVGDAITQIVASGLPALPVVAPDGRIAGIFGEREFIAALFPGYVGELRSAAFVPRSIEEHLEKRAACHDQPVGKYMNTERVAVTRDYSDVQVAETFLHHRVLIVPIVDERQRPTGLITRSDFFRALVDRFKAVLD